MEMNNWKKILTPYTQAVEELKIKFKGMRNEYINRKSEEEEYST